MTSSPGSNLTNCFSYYTQDSSEWSNTIAGADPAFEEGPSLPVPSDGHCQLTVNSSHVLVLGGGEYGSGELLVSMLNWDTQEW